MQPSADHKQHVTHHDDVNLLDYWRVVVKYRKSIIAIVLLASIAAVTFSLLIPNTYKAQAVIMTVSTGSKGGGLSSMASRFGGLASLAGIQLPGGGGNSAKFMALLNSRTLIESVINRMNLMPILFKDAWDSKKGAWKAPKPEDQPDMEKAVTLMRGHVTIARDKKMNTIKIQGVFLKPELAARAVNAYIAELQHFIKKSTFTSAKRNRMFVEEQLAENKMDLLVAGKEINEFYKKNRVSNVEAMVDVSVGGTQIDDESNAVEKSTFAELDISSSDGVVSDVSGLMVQEVQIDEKIKAAKIVEDVPQQVYLTYLMMRRELLAKVNALLTTQYEMAKIEEAKEDLAFETIDKAVPPIRKYKPKRAHLCMMVFTAALFGAIFLAFFREYLKKMKALRH